MWQTIIKNTAWLSGGELIARLLRGILVIAAARVLGAASWGILSYALSLAALFTIAADIGISSVLTRELVKHPEQRAAYLSTSFFIKLVLAAAAVLILFSLMPYLARINLTPAILIVASLLVIFDNLRIFNNGLIRALEKMHLEAIEKIIVQAIILILGILVLLYGASAVNLAAVYLAGSIAGAALTVWLLRVYLKRLFAGFDKKLVKSIVNASWPFALVGMTGGIMLNTDIIMLGWFRPAADIGYYSAAQKAIIFLYAAPSLIAAATFPSLARFANVDQNQFAKVLIQSLKLTFLLAFPIAIGGMIIGPDLINLVFGPQYQPAAAAFRLLLITILINFPAILISNALFAYEKQNDFIKYSALGAGSNVLFNFILIPPFGIEGAAVATIATQLISNIFIWKKLRAANPFTIGGRLNKIIIASAVMGAAVWLINNFGINILIIIPAAAVIYLGTLYLLGETILTSAGQFLWPKKI